MEKEKREKITTMITPSLLKRAKHYAINQNMTFAKLVDVALTSYLDSVKDGQDEERAPKT